MNENTNPTILIVDDIPANLKIFYDVLQPEGYRIFTASNGTDAIRIAARSLPDIILLDIMMPGMDGYEVCRRLKQDPNTEHIPVIFVTAMDDPDGIVKGFQSGGVDYITRPPLKKEEVLTRVETRIKLSRLMQELLQKNRELQEEISRREKAEKAHRQASDALQRADEQLSMISQQEASRWGIEAFVGKSTTIKRILADVRHLQSAGTTSVLITGESGTGKELIARAIHFGGIRSQGPFIPVNCSAIPRELAESAFFGHIKGAFSGANDSRKGYFELADGGTLFLDEMGDMPLDLQPKLLRVIEDGFIIPVGGASEKHVKVRILAATNQNLAEEIATGRFREDLYYRLARFTVIVPPLREHKEDILLLAEHFLSMFSAEMGIVKPVLSPEAEEALVNYPFPGNIRELKNIIESALIKSGEAIIKAEHLNLSAIHSFDSQKKDKHKLDQNKLEELMIKRIQKQDTGTEQALSTDEGRILDYIRRHGSICNSECQSLLSVDRNRATYLLQKLQRYGLLICEGEQRWSRYYIP